MRSPKMLVAALLGAALVVALACGNKPKPQSGCSADKDCAVGQRCTAGACKPVSCTSTLDCPTGSVCTGGVCGVPQPDGGTAPDGGQNNAPAIAATPSALDFGAARVGEKISLDLSLQNVGNAALNVSDVRLGDATSPEFTFTTSRPIPAQVAPNDKNPLVVHVTYQPVDNKADLDGNVTITSNDPQNPVVKIPLTMSFKGLSEIAILEDVDGSLPDARTVDLGQTALNGSAVKPLYIANVGTANAPLTLSQIYVEPAGGAFTVTPTLGAGDPPRYLSPLRICNKDKQTCGSLETCTKANDPAPAMGYCLDSAGKPADAVAVSVRFAPTAAGAQTATLKVVNDEQNGGNDLNENPVDQVALTGTGVKAQIQVSPSPVDFGDVYLGQSGTKTVTLTNAGSGTLKVTAVAMGASPSPFQLTAPALPLSLGAGQSATASLSFAATTVGAYSDTLTVTSDDPQTPTLGTPVTANAVIPPKISVAPAGPYDVGEVQLGQTKTLSLTVSNPGGQALVIKKTAVSPTTPADFSFTTPPANVAPSGSFTLGITYAPPAGGVTGKQGGDYIIYCNDPTLPQDFNGDHYLVVSFTGTATDPVLTVQPASHDFGSVYRLATVPPPVGVGAAPFVFTVSNTGSGSLTVSAVKIANDVGGAFAVALPSGVTLPKVLAPNQSFTATVGFVAPSVGSFGATLQVDSDDVDKPTGEAKALAGVGLGCAANTWDIDGDPNNGCEYACALSNGGVETCDDKDNDCNGTVDDLPAVDSACAASLGSLHATGHCANPATPTAACVIDACLPNYWDLDGNPANGCEYACTVASSTDLPDDALADANCDGIDGSITQAVFVDCAGGNDTATGSKTNPVRTIGRALQLGIRPTRDQVLVAGSCAENVTLKEGVGLYGGYTAGTWARNLGNPATIAPIASGVAAVSGSAIALQTNLDDFIIRAAPGTSLGESSIGIALDGSSGVVVKNCDIQAGAGQRGQDGSDGAPAPTATGGGTGGGGNSNSSAGGDPGPAGTSPCGNGGQGGLGGYDSTGGDVGQAAPAGGACGGASGAWGLCSSGDSSCGTMRGSVGGTGCTGATGGNGGAGVPGNAHGTAAAGAFTPSDGTDGSDGTNGTAGGGGGGGGGGSTDMKTYVAFFCVTTSFCNADRGGGGGGGGGAGCKGLRGTGGKGGGASIGALLVNSSPQISNTRLTTAKGGKGGNGGNGSAGSAGGTGGQGGSSADDSGGGGPGGNGGKGGNGGSGGGGGGGPSVNVYKVGGSAPSLSGVTYVNGGGGLGGSGGAGAGNGAAGIGQNVYP